MGRSATNPREVAANLVEECGPYATMAALFLASEARENDDTEGEIFWTRVAAAISADSSMRKEVPRMHFCGAGHA
jgi:hypothetical protein